jgi:hypothetical protein
MMSRHWKISTDHHFQNGRHNTAKIKHCPISSQFDMWVDNDVPNWFPTLTNFYRSSFSKWPPQYCTNSTLSDFNAISYVGRLWCPELIPDIEKFLPVGLFKNGRHNTAQIQHCPISTTFHMWVDYDVPKRFLTSTNFYRSPFSKWPPQYRTNSTLFDFNVLNWFPTLANFYWSPFSKWPPQYRKDFVIVRL